MPLDGEDRGADANKPNSSLLFFADLVTAKAPEKQGCQRKIERGCFPLGVGNPECPDIDTCPESAK